MKVAQKKGQPEFTPVPYLNPDLIPCLVGCSNKAPVIVDRQEMTALIDSGAQVSSISSQFCGDCVLQIQPLGQLLELEGQGFHHPTPQVCGGQYPDPRDQELQ